MEPTEHTLKYQFDSQQGRINVINGAATFSYSIMVLVERGNVILRLCECFGGRGKGHLNCYIVLRCFEERCQFINLFASV